MKESKNRVLVIGLDGATFDLIDPWITEGYLPNLTRLINRGVRGQLRSTIQPTTAPAWVSFMTGVNQGKHGLYDFVRRHPASYNLEITNGLYVKARSLFAWASEQGKRVVSVNVPYTAPPHPVNGVMVGGPFAPTFSPDLVYPRSYFEKIREWVPDYFVLPDYDSRAIDPMASYAARLFQGIDMREKLCLKLLESEDWDLFMVVFMATDEAQHTFWHSMVAEPERPEARYQNTILRVYERLDRAIGNLLTAACEDGHPVTTLVVSDHGAGPFRWMINLNRWLSDHGFLEFREETGGSLRQFRTSLLKKLALAYRKYVSGETRLKIRTRLGRRHFDRVKGGFESILMSSAIDWHQTRAYSIGAGGNIYINLQGREPAGVVKEDDYDTVRDELAEALRTMRDPETGELLVRAVHPREALYHGEQVDYAPDLVIEWKSYGDWGRGQYDSTAEAFQKQRQMDFSEQPLSGSHRLDGILIADGPGVKCGAHIEGAHLFDMAPTILSLLGVAPPSVMDGKILAELFTPEALSTMTTMAALPAPEPGDKFLQAESQSTFTAEEEEQIAEHLRSLGYL